MMHTVSSLKEETKEHQLLMFDGSPASEVLQAEHYQPESRRAY